MVNPNLTKVILKADYSRRFPDPLNNSLEMEDIYNIEHHILLVKAIDVPSGISLDCNPRRQKIDSGIYKDVQESLESGSEPLFHLKNKGITMFAHKVDISEDKKIITAYLAPGDGIADGGHTYQIILDSKTKNKCPDNQYVKFEIVTGVKNEHKVDIIGGLNTAVQVQEATLLNYEREFDWFKEIIQKMPYADKIAYMQNEKGDFDIRDIIAFLTLFNIEHPDLNGRHPREAYISKAACLNLYTKDDGAHKESYKMLKPIIKDILLLHDYIHLNVGKRYNAEKKEKGDRGRAHGMEGVFDSKKKGKYKFIFAGEESEYKLFDGTFYPIFGAMRYLVERKEGEDVYSWKTKSFDEVKKVFDSAAADLLTATYNLSLRYGRKPNPIGKDENHWGYLYQIVKSAYLENAAK